MTVTTVGNAPRTVITRINDRFVAIAQNVVQPNLSSTGTVGVANEPTDVTSRTVSSSSSSNNNNNSRITAILNDNLGKPGSAGVCVTSHLGTEDWLTRVRQLGDNVSARKHSF